MTVIQPSSTVVVENHPSPSEYHDYHSPKFQTLISLLLRLISADSLPRPTGNQLEELLGSNDLDKKLILGKTLEVFVEGTHQIFLCRQQ